MITDRFFFSNVFIVQLHDTERVLGILFYFFTVFILTDVLTAFDFDVTQLPVHWEVLQVHGARRSYCQAATSEIVQRY